MKKSWFYAVLIISLGAVSIWLFLRETNSTVNKQLTDFTISDTASITKIFLADKSNKTVLLERQAEGYWLVNKENKARQDMVNNLLKTIKIMKVRTPVPKSMHNTVVRSLAGNSTKIEIYQNNQESPMKTYYVGGPNKDHTGSYMLLEGSSVPFVLHIEGHYGYLSSRYSTNHFVWRDNWIWQFPGKQLTKIKEIKITNYANPSESFSVVKDDDLNYKLFDSDGNQKQIATGQILEYVKRYEGVAFEGYEETKKAQFLDSVRTNIEPWHTIELTTTDGLTTKVTTWPKPMKKGSVALLSGDTIAYDMDRLYAYINDEKMVIGQHFTFGPLTIEASTFDN